MLSGRQETLLRAWHSNRAATLGTAVSFDHTLLFRDDCSQHVEYLKIKMVFLECMSYGSHGVKLEKPDQYCTKDKIRVYIARAICH